VTAIDPAETAPSPTTATRSARYPLQPVTRAALLAAGLDPVDLLTVLDRALAEDLGTRGDLTSAATVDPTATFDVRYVSRQPGTAAGIPVLAALLDVCLGPAATVQLLARDGGRLEPGDVLAEVRGPAQKVLAVERLSLNLLSHLSGIATATHAWVEAVAGTPAHIRDTRKTTPGLRDLEKYAVRCGGGVNHRRGLDDGVLIKDNHVTAAGGVGAALDRVQAAQRSGRTPSGIVVQIEVDDLDQLDEALDHGATQVLLDNFTEPDLIRAVALVRARDGEVLLEVSGRLRLDRAAAIAGTGVDLLAVGALTHSAPILDIGVDAA
jgi:nicotinate-nucleotide pyrophosphorylase (carboxylating)